MATTPYLDLSGFTNLTLAPAAYVTEIETAEAGWTLRRLTHWTAWINSRLSKRYAVPFASPYPETAITWLCEIVTEEIYLKVGIDTTSAQQDRIKERAEQAKAQVQEAADAERGLFELPLRADLESPGVTRGSPLVYSEQSPYKWTTVQWDEASLEDQGL